jgi:membrane protein DedA with SNARE-associated domain
MLELSERILGLLFGLSPSTIYVAVGLLCWAEAPFFLGFVTPGELAVAAGGVLASRGQVELGWLVAVAVAGTLTGNTTGFLMGRRWGARMLGWKPLQRVLGSSIGKARDFMARRGEWAIVLGRLSTPTRIIVPFLAGASPLPYRRYVLFDLPISVVWAVVWGLLGYGLAGSWTALQRVAGAAAFLVLALFIAGLVIRWLAARIAANQPRVQAGFRFLLDATGVRRLTPVFGWLGRRFDPRFARGLGLTFGFLALIGAVAAIGLVMSQTRAVRGLALLDFPVLEWMGATRTAEAVWIARVVLAAFHWPEVLGVTFVVVAVCAWRTGVVAAFRVAVGVVGATAGAYFLDRFVLEGLVPHAEYPSVPVAAAAALMAHATAGAARRWGWGASVTAAAVGFFLVCTVALAAVVAGWTAPSGILLGFAIGLGWATTLELPGVVLRSEPPEPSPREPTVAGAGDPPVAAGEWTRAVRGEDGSPPESLDEAESLEDVDPPESDPTEPDREAGPEPPNR